MYSDAGGEPAVAPEKEKDAEGATALLPKSFFPDPPEVGKTCTIRTTKVFDDQVQVEYVHSEEAPAEEEEDMGTAPEEPMSDMMA